MKIVTQVLPEKNTCVSTCLAFLNGSGRDFPSFPCHLFFFFLFFFPFDPLHPPPPPLPATTSQHRALHAYPTVVPVFVTRKASRSMFRIKSRAFTFGDSSHLLTSRVYPEMSGSPSVPRGVSTTPRPSDESFSHFEKQKRDLVR